MAYAAQPSVTQPRFAGTTQPAAGRLPPSSLTASLPSNLLQRPPAGLAAGPVPPVGSAAGANPSGCVFPRKRVPIGHLLNSPPVSLPQNLLLSQSGPTTGPRSLLAPPLMPKAASNPSFAMGVPGQPSRTLSTTPGGTPPPGSQSSASLGAQSTTTPSAFASGFPQARPTPLRAPQPLPTSLSVAPRLGTTSTPSTMPLRPPIPVATSRPPVSVAAGAAGPPWPPLAAPVAQAAPAEQNVVNTGGVNRPVDSYQSGLVAMGPGTNGSVPNSLTSSRSSTPAVATTNTPGLTQQLDSAEGGGNASGMSEPSLTNGLPMATPPSQQARPPLPQSTRFNPYSAVKSSGTTLMGAGSHPNMPTSSSFQPPGANVASPPLFPVQAQMQQMSIGGGTPSLTGMNSGFPVMPAPLPGGPPPPPLPGGPPPGGPPPSGPPQAGFTPNRAGPPQQRPAGPMPVGPMASFGKPAAGSLRSGEVDLMRLEADFLPDSWPQPPKPKLHGDLSRLNCSSDLMRCTLNAIPESPQLLNKSRLPLGLLLHPFKDLSQLPVVSGGTIVRCRTCRTYINPFVYFIDSRRWKCNVCFRLNDVPDEFSYDPVTKTYGDPQRRPEMRSSTIEFVAPQEYMLRPPQPAVYLFLLDVSQTAIQTGYLEHVCEVMLRELDRIPGDSRTQVGFITFAERIHYFNLSENLSQPQMLVMCCDLEDTKEEPFLPLPDGLLVNLRASRELIEQLLKLLPSLYTLPDRSGPAPVEGVNPCLAESGSCAGFVLQVGYKLMAPVGGRITFFISELPSHGPGALQSREDPNDRSAQTVRHLQPANDFYKRMALDCSGVQLAVDLFVFNSRYTDLATISQVSRHSSGHLYYYPNLHSRHNLGQCQRFRHDLKRYLTRKIGFEAVMRVRCTQGINLHSFHGNFFVRSTDLLSLPNVSPDAGYAIQLSLEESLSDLSVVSMQAALLYTSSKGERRIRVHTLCLPICSNVSEVFECADQESIVAFLSKMAVARAEQSGIQDARAGIVNACVDALSAYRKSSGGNSAGTGGRVAVPMSLRLYPLLCHALLKLTAFTVGSSVKLDDRVAFMDLCRTLPVRQLMRKIYPRMYPLHHIERLLNEDEADKATGLSNGPSDPALSVDTSSSALMQEESFNGNPSPSSSSTSASTDTSSSTDTNDSAPAAEDHDETTAAPAPTLVSARSAPSAGSTTNIPQLPLLQLSSRNLDRDGVYLIDCGDIMYVYVCSALSQRYCREVLGVAAVDQLQEGWLQLPLLETSLSRRTRAFVQQLLNARTFHAPLFLCRDNGHHRLEFHRYMLEDRTDSSNSYHEFLQFIQKELNN